MANSELFISELKSGCCRQTIVAPHLANGRLESGEWRVEKGGGAHGFDLLLLDEKSRPGTVKQVAREGEAETAQEYQQLRRKHIP
ncbi:unnamed protein product [Brassica oleracea var. botrytis]|uniref:(rape) hypothetical protein n=1 Tax=Brassica napus TaxID=3708 RepID=A0A816KBB2_BRANA|nr:unnamed protein product [Brassica napus]